MSSLANPTATSDPIKVSVLLPVYGPGEPLKRAIESILKQTFTDFEFIIIDDASKDSSAKIIEDFAKRDPRIRAILHKTNIGLANSLNEGLKLAKAPIIIRMDHDDEALPNRIATQMAFLASHPDVALVGSYVYHMGAHAKYDRLVSVPTTHQEIATTLPKYNCMYHPSVAMRRDMVLELGGYRGDFKNAEDYDLWLRISQKFTIANIDQPLLRYRFSVGGMTLGKKWEQYYYVHLAKAAFLNPGADSDTIKEHALRALASEDRLTFMTCVYSGTVDEMIALRHWREGWRLAMRSSTELGWGGALKLLKKLMYARAKALFSA